MNRLLGGMSTQKKTRKGATHSSNRVSLSGWGRKNIVRDNKKNRTSNLRNLKSNGKQKTEARSMMEIEKQKSAKLPKVTKKSSVLSIYAQEECSTPKTPSISSDTSPPTSLSSSSSLQSSEAETQMPIETQTTEGDEEEMMIPTIVAQQEFPPSSPSLNNEENGNVDIIFGNEEVEDEQLSESSIDTCDTMDAEELLDRVEGVLRYTDTVQKTKDLSNKNKEDINDNKKKKVNGKRSKYSKSKHQRKSVGAITHEVLKYDNLIISKKAVILISDATIHFGKLIMENASKLKSMKKQKGITITEVKAVVLGLVPSSLFSFKMQQCIENSLSRFNMYLLEKERHKNDAGNEGNKKKNISTANKCGLYINVSNVKNLSFDVLPKMHILSKKAMIGIAACMQEMQTEIIHRCAKGIISEGTNNRSTTDGMNESDILMSDIKVSCVRFTVNETDVHRVIKRRINIEQIQEYVNNNQLFLHRRLDITKEVVRKVDENEANKKSKDPIIKANAKKTKKRAIVNRTIKKVAMHNKEKILNPEECQFLLIQENIFPMIFKDFNIPSPHVIPNVRMDILPEKAQKKYKLINNCQFIDSSISSHNQRNEEEEINEYNDILGKGNYSSNMGYTLGMLQFMVNCYLQKEEETKKKWIIRK